MGRTCVRCCLFGVGERVFGVFVRRTCVRLCGVCLVGTCVRFWGRFGVML
jgi:hypothetical protein